MNDIKRPTPRAIKVTDESLETIANMSMQFDAPPNMDELLDVAVLPATYYFVTDCPGVTPEKSISWAIVPDVIFDKRFAFATKPSSTRLISIVEKD